MPLSDVEKAICKAVVVRFISDNKPTTRRSLLRQFKGALPESIQKLVTFAVLKGVAGTTEAFLPTSLAFRWSGDADAVRFGKRSLEVVLRTLQVLFDRDLEQPEQPDYTPADIEAEAKKLKAEIGPGTIRVGLYLAGEHGVFATVRSDPEYTEITALRIGERILTIGDIDNVWDDHIKQWGARLEQDQAPNADRPADALQSEEVSSPNQQIDTEGFSEAAAKVEKEGAARGASTQPPSYVYGQLVMEAQKCLSDLGFGPLIPDGILGPGTLSAMKHFQQQNGLPETSYLDDTTLAKLRELAVQPSPQPTPVSSSLPKESIDARGFDVARLKADLNDATIMQHSPAPEAQGEAAAGATIRPPSQPPVYISYAPEDLAWMTRVAMYLADAGFYVPDPPHADSSVRSEIAAEQLRRQSRVFVLLVSFHYLESEEIHKTEFPDIRSLVQGDSRRIIYVILEQCPWSSRLALGLPATVIPIGGSALSEKNEEQVKDELHTLARAVRSAIQETDKAAGAPHPEPASQPQTKQQAEEQAEESIEISSISDAATDKDTLGFKPYVEAISRFLLSADTKPPLTLSIEGEWGSGKTSFMLQLKNAVTGEKLWTRLKKNWVEANGNAPEAPSRNTPERRLRLWEALKKKRRFSVQFNPWRHDKEDSLWAAFALEFLRQASRQRFLFRRWWGHARLFWAHYRWRSGWFEMLRAMVVWLALGVLVIGSIEVMRYKPRWAEEMLVALSKRLNSPEMETSRPKNGELPSATEGEKEKVGQKGTANFDPILRMLLLIGGNAAYFAVVLTIWLKVKDLVGNPLEINLKKYLRSPDYEGRVAFVEQFHADFRRIVDAYAGKEKVFVFIDDLDRCEVPKAAELMKAVNLMIADDPRLIFILGMDREKVAAGLAVKYERILPYLSSEGAGTAEDLQWKRRWGLGFGQDFLQKFIQLPFRVPEPNPEKYDDFIKTISASLKSSSPVLRDEAPSVPESRDVRQTRGTNVPIQTNAPAEIPTAPAPTPAEVRARRERELQFRGDSDKVRAVASMVAETLGRNPRRLKQFVNLFRLQAYIVNEIGLFDRGHGGTPPVTLEQLGKFVAIGLRWPALLADFAEESRLLGKLEELAIGGAPGSTDTLNRWLSERRMQGFLTYGMQKQREEYTLSNPSLFQLLHICPQRVRPAGGPDNKS